MVAYSTPSCSAICGSPEGCAEVLPLQPNQSVPGRIASCSTTVSPPACVSLPDGTGTRLETMTVRAMGFVDLESCMLGEASNDVTFRGMTCRPGPRIQPNQPLRFLL